MILSVFITVISDHDKPQPPGCLLDCFTHYRTGEQAEDEAALMAAILADATNAGAERMAQSSRGVTIHQMMVMMDRHLRTETYASATSCATGTSFCCYMG
ncbi:transposase [Escherichia coli]|nr:transposase [Escherichia coli]EEZ0077390.1 transposase [Escherichia coli]EFG8634678.1 transposase [Escherichia coli]EGE6984687.1 transposase [Escherichia coli]MWF11957.1 Tn3 family transposase [Escherichia coli]